jgi:outer membrane protein assembly factor BamB
MMRSLILIAGLIFLLTPVVPAQNASEQVRSSKCWEFSQTGYEIAEGHVVSDGILISNNAGSVIFLSKNGEKLWQSEAFGTLRSNLEANERGVFMVSKIPTNTGDSFVFRELSLQTGLPTFSIDLGTGSRWRLLRSGNQILAYESYGRALAIDVNERSRSWERPGGDPVIDAEFANEETIGIAAAGGEVFLLSAIDGKEIGRANLLRGISAFHISGDSIFLGNAAGEMIAGRTNGSGANWKFRTGGRITHILEASHSILAGSNDNFVYSFEPAKGTLQWKRRLSGRISGIVPVMDDFLAVSVLDSKDWDLIDARNGRFAGRMIIDGDDAARSSAFAFPDGIAISAPSSISFYSFGNCKQ